MVIVLINLGGIYRCHTFGHAPIIDLQRFAKAIKPDKLVPIHTFEPNLYQEYITNVKIQNDLEW